MLNVISETPTGAITAKKAKQQTTVIAEVATAGDAVYWLESIPNNPTDVELLRSTTAGIEAVSAPGHNIGTTAGLAGSYTISHGALIYSTTDHSVWRSFAPNEAQLILPRQSSDTFYTGFVHDPTRQAAYAIQNTTQNGPHAVTFLDLHGKTPPRIVLNAVDYYQDLTIAPGGGRIAWIQWSAPHRPWEASALWVADLNPAGTPTNARMIAGGPTTSVEQPTWLDSNELLYLTDDTGTSQFYRHHLTTGHTRQLTNDTVDYGHPRWTQHTSSYARVDSNTIVTAYSENGFRKIRSLSLRTGATAEVMSPFAWVQRVTASRGEVIAAGTRIKDASAIMRRTGPSQWHVLAQSTDLTDVRDQLPIPQAITWDGPAGPIHAFYYAPPTTGDDTDTPPPVILTLHDGPNACATPGANINHAYWTSRGYAVCDINYSGSVGYGRAYRDRLRGRWGDLDVADVISAAHHLIDTDSADPNRILLRAHGAAALTALGAVAHSDVFTGCTLYGAITDYEILRQVASAEEVAHLDVLLGRWPNARVTYHQRSPARQAGLINAAMLFIHGMADTRAPILPVRKLHDQLIDRGVASSLVECQGTNHDAVTGDQGELTLAAEAAFYDDIAPATASA